MMTASARPPCRLTVCRVAQKDLAGVCSQTTGSRPWLLLHKRPRRSMPGRLRIRVAWRSNMGRLLRAGTAGGRAIPPARRPRLQTTGRDQGGQPVGVLAVVPAAEPLAVTGAARPVEVDVVRLPVGLQADLADLEAPAVVGRDRGQQVVGLLLADRD